MTSEKIRLLIAEDQPLIRRALASLFEAEADVEVVAQAGDGAEAVRMARAWSPDVALLDIKMPRLNGIEAARQITQELPAIKVVMLTTFDTDDLVFDAILAGAVGYLLKEAEEREIVATVRDAARGQSRLSPSIARRVLDDFRRIKKPRVASDGDSASQALTARESLVLDLIVEGKANKDISRALSLAEGTVKNHVSNILSKLHARSRTELAVKALNKPR
jgi:DNA-binding NarL/FixJ family response regulator